MSHKRTQQKPQHNSLARDVAICVFIVGATLAAYWPVGGQDFVVFDDRMYVTENPNVQAGLTWEGLKWAFSSSHAYNWHPLTWLSHMLDCEVFGLNPTGHHFSSLVFHILNALLIFLVFSRMTSAVWPSAFVAALFALHPLHVESVAWVAERKDVLSTFFWMLTMGTYVLYSERKDAKTYLLCIFFFSLGLMAKPMLVTLPFVLLLLDYWPLGRLQPGQRVVKSQEHGTGKPGNARPRSRDDLAANRPRRQKIALTSTDWKAALGLVREKIPFFLLAAGSCAITLYAQQGVMQSYELYPLGTRVSNALVSYVGYMGKMVRPTGLAVFYPHPGDTLAAWQIIGAAGLLIVGLTISLLWFVRRPYLTMGWLWFLGTLVPVIGLVQVGLQASADRYTYIPLVGLFLAISWGAADLMSRWRYRHVVQAIAAGTVVLVLTAMTRSQVGTWKDSLTLFRHATEVTDRNYWAHYNLGLVLLKQGDLDRAFSHFKESFHIKPDRPDTVMNMGVVFARRGDLDGAITYFLKTLDLQPDRAEAHFNLGLAFSKKDLPGKAFAHLSEAVRLDPDDPEANYLVGLEWAKQGDHDKALDFFSEALRLNPRHARAHNHAGVTLAQQRKLPEALAHFREAARLEPGFPDARKNLSAALDLEKKIDRAIEEARALLTVHPGDPGLLHGLGNLYAKKGLLDKAVKQYRKALSARADDVNVLNDLAMAHWNRKAYEKAASVFTRIIDIQPERGDVYYNLACMYALQNRQEESIRYLKKALDKGYDNWDLVKTDKDLTNIRDSSAFKELLGNR